MAKQQASEAELASRREVTEDDYAAMLAVGNRNVDDSVSAR